MIWNVLLIAMDCAHFMHGRNYSMEAMESIQHEWENYGNLTSLP